MPSAQRLQQHIPALDGIRAIAIVAVILFHMGATWLPGGYLGVDVFFVLSGYLITWILLDRLRRLGRINFKEFYLARARRLVPALLFLFLGIAMVVHLRQAGLFRRNRPPFLTSAHMVAGNRSTVLSTVASSDHAGGTLFAYRLGSTHRYRWRSCVLGSSCVGGSSIWFRNQWCPSVFRYRHPQQWPFSWRRSCGCLGSAESRFVHQRQCAQKP